MAGKVPKRVLYDGDERCAPDARALADPREAPRPQATTRSSLACAAALEEEGFELLPQAELAPELLAPEGALGAHAPSADAARRRRFGWPIAKALGGLDVGQTVVVRDRAVLALEAIEGTDARDPARRCARPRRRLRREGGEAAAGPALRRADDRPRDGRARSRAGGAALLAVEAGAHAACSSARRSSREADAAGIALLGVDGRAAGGAERRRVSALRIAVIGCGHMGSLHAREGGALARARATSRFAGAADLDLARAEQAAAPYGARARRRPPRALRARGRGDRRGADRARTSRWCGGARGRPRRAGREADRGHARRGRGAARARARARRALLQVGHLEWFNAARAKIARVDPPAALRRGAPHGPVPGPRAPTSTSCAT